MKININRRVNPILGRLPKSEDLTTRIALIAIPFLSLYKPARTGIAVFSGSVQVIALFQSKKSTTDKLVKTSAYAFTIFLSIYRPQVALALTLGAQTIDDVKNRKVYDILSRIVYFCSIYYRRPELVVASLVMQLGKEAKESYGEYKEGKYLEAFAKLLMIALRTYQTKEEISRVHRRYFGKEVTQTDWDQISQEKDISKALKKKNISDVIKNVTIKPMPRKQSEDVKLKDIIFERCNFSKSKLDRNTIENVTFNSCDMKEIYLYQVSMTQVVWNNCQLEKGTFYRCSGEGLTFNGCDLTRFCMSNSMFSGLEIFSSNLYGASFLETHLIDSVIKSSDLVNVLLCGANFTLTNCTKNVITKPVIALTWDFQGGGSWGEPVPEVLEDQGALCLKFPIYPNDINKKLLRKEVQEKLSSLENYSISRAQGILDDPTPSPEMDEVKRKAKNIMSFADGVILSGGEDVESIFYSDSRYDWDFRRSMMEFAMVHIGKPVMGICRGCQVLNVYFGGTIKDISGGFGSPSLEIKGKFQSQFGKNVVGYSAHSQAADQMGKGLQVIIKKGEIIKAFMNRDQTVIGTQFHPEKYVAGKVVKDKLKKGDIHALFVLFAVGYKEQFGNSPQVQKNIPNILDEEFSQLSAAGEKTVIAMCNKWIEKGLRKIKEMESNQIFFKVFLNRVRANRGGSTPQLSRVSLEE